jgi:hypothetical protein
MKNEQNIIVTFSCNDRIHHYKGIRGVKPMLPYKIHNSIEDACKYLMEKRNVKDPIVIEK